jgi:hypothetical protein
MRGGAVWPDQGLSAETNCGLVWSDLCGVAGTGTAVEWQLRRDGETGIHSRLKICFPATEVWVRVPLPLPPFGNAR